MAKSAGLTAKFTRVLAIGVVATCSVMVLILALMVVGRENSLIIGRAQGNSRLLAASLTFAMSNGATDVGPIESALKGLEGITEFRVIALPEMSQIKPPEPDAIEKTVFSEGRERVDSIEGGKDGRVLRLTGPIVANESCLACHAGIRADQVVAVTTMFLSTRDSQRFIGSFTLQAVLLTIAATLILIATIWLTLRFIVIAPLRRMRDLVGDIANGAGDLTRRVTISSEDEVGAVAGLVNRFVDQTHDVVRNIRGVSTENELNARSLTAVAERTLGTVAAAKASAESTQRQLSEMNEQNSSVSATVTGMLGGITTLAERIEGQSRSVAQSSSAIGQMSASIESVAKVTDRKLEDAKELLAVTRSGSEKVGEVNAEITDIAKSVNNIGQAIQIINSIASQTNLLSMNAAIEAAHAGEYGAGFAVVAEEIRHLAESSAKNAKQVTAVLKDIIKRINHALEASTESSASLAHIGEEVDELVEAFTEIAGSTRQLADGGRDILSASESLLRATEDIRAGSVEMNAGAEQINRSHVVINRLSSQSKVAIDEVTRRAVEMEGAIGEIAKLSVEGRSLGQKLGEAVGRFKVNED